MISKLSKHIMATCLALFVSGMLTCCSDDVSLDGNANNKSQYPDDTTIGFEISLDAVVGNSTRAEGDTGTSTNETDDDEIDNYVDVDKLRILFFDTDDNFLFDASDYEIVKSEVSDYYYDEDGGDKSSSRATRRWWVKVPVATLEKNGVLETLKQKDFKIAVLANWPTEQELSFDPGDKIYKISQYWPDNIYNPVGPETDDNFRSYGHLGKISYISAPSEEPGDEEGESDASSSGLMGAYKQWVQNAYSSQNATTEAIRNNKSATPYQIARVYNGGMDYKYTYKHIWRVWNFGNKDLILGSDNNKEYWSQRIWPERLEKVEGFELDAQGNKVYTGKIGTLDNYGALYPKSSANGLDRSDGLSFVGTNATSSGNQNNLSGNAITLRKALSLDQHKNATKVNGNGTTAYLPTNYFSFNAFATGTLTIWASGGSSTTPGYIGIQKGGKESDKADEIKKTRVVSKAIPETKISTEILPYTFDIAVTGTNSDNVPGDPVNVKIYAIDATIKIHQIEYIEDKYLYESDREAILPTKEYAIPMYGVQEFGAIGENLVPGQMFNMSSSYAGLNDYIYEYNEETGEYTNTMQKYKPKKIYLLRSLAKVELLLPSNVEPKHVYMRFINRYNRCEPMDVSMPTNEAWYNIDKEAKYLTEKGRFFDTNTKDIYDNNSNDGYALYRNELAWFYGAWTQWKLNKADDSDEWEGWDWNGQNISVQPAEEGQFDYPRIFNTRISRSNYAHMIKSGTRNGKTRYLIYVPDKSVADPNTRGRLYDTPKIAHIELRTSNENEENLDDNDCYRIYFANTQPPPQAPGNRYDTAEEKYINNFLPVVRNHIYRFNVISVGGAMAKSRNGGAMTINDCEVTVSDF